MTRNMRMWLMGLCLSGVAAGAFAWGAIEGVCGTGGTCYSAPAQTNKPKSPPSTNNGSQAFGDAMNNYSNSLRESDNQRRQQEQQQWQTGDQQKIMEENRKLAEENRRLKEQTDAWKEQQKKDNDKAKNKTAKAADPTKGCAFLVYPEYGFTHDPGARFCYQGKAMSCDMNGTRGNGVLTYGWHTMPATFCSDLPSPQTRESNLVNLQKVNDNFFEEESF